MKNLATVGKRANKDRPECCLLAFMAPIASGYNHATTGLLPLNMAQIIIVFDTINGDNVIPQNDLCWLSRIIFGYKCCCVKSDTLLFLVFSLQASAHCLFF